MDVLVSHRSLPCFKPLRVAGAACLSLALTSSCLAIAKHAPAQKVSPSVLGTITRYPTGGGPLGSLATASGDFNGDGILDIAVTNMATSSISILFGTGAGNYAAPINYTVGNTPYGLVVGDFNADGKPDLAVSNAGDNTVTVLLNQGNGVFPASPSSTYSVGSEPFGLLIGDFNKDGIADLAVANVSSGTISVLMGVGDGTFQGAATYNTGSYPLGVLAGDFNGDGFPDLVVWNFNDNTVGILQNDKTGKFGAQVTYATGSNPWSTTIADFNGDGFPDLAVANVGGSTLSLLLNDRTGKFLPQTSVPAGNAPISVIARDLDGDGNADLIYANYLDGTVGVRMGIGDGTFSAASTVSAGSEPYALMTGDFKGTGRPGVVITYFSTNSIALALPAVPSVVDQTTYHFNNARTGLNPYELTLKPSNVNSSQFGKLNMLPTSGKVDAEPLYLSALTIAGVSHNVVYVASEDDTLYAYDADTGSLLWKTSMLGTSETTSEAVDGCDQITPQIGITSTPVIDRTLGAHGIIFVVAMSKDSKGAYHQRIHGLDITTGLEAAGSPQEITGSYPGTGDNSVNGSVIFDPHQYAERVGLLLSNKTIYLGWTSHCDIRPYTGWVMAYSETTLKQTQILNLTPNGNDGAVWMSGAGLAADAKGSVYLLDANGLLDGSFNAQGFPASGDYGNAILKLSSATGKLMVADYFEPYNTASESDQDIDLGSGGVLLLPDQVDGSGGIHRLLVGAGKDQNIYVGDRDNLGKFNAANNSNVYQELPASLPHGAWSMPAYFNGTVYYGGVSDVLRAFSVRNAKLSTSPTSVSKAVFGYPGATPSISSNGNTNGIVWALESGLGSPGVLHAYDATNLALELYNSNQAANSRDAYGNGNKFITPVIVNGRVFVPTQNGVAVFGLLAQP